MAAVVMTQPANSSAFYMNPQSGPSPPEYGKNIYMDTSSQTSPSSSISPTNYHSNVNARQLRQPRQPLYTPAALRPTDKSARPTDIPGRPRAPDTPPASKDSSFDSAKNDAATAVEFAPDVSFGLQEGDHDINVLRRGLSRAASENYSEEELGEVTGPPTTAHWKPDASSNACFICNESFTWYFRRHHCRRCGNLVCGYDIQNTVPLDQNARYHPQGQISKACKTCYDGWRIIRRLHHSRASSIAESNSSQGTAMPIPKLGRPKDDLRVGSMARSEGGMVWSTF